MAQQQQLVDELKAVLKESRLGYRDVAGALGLSVASVKRLFATREFTLSRLDRICALAGVEVSDLVERMNARRPLLTELTPEQEDELMADPKLFLMTYLMLNRWSVDDISRTYRLERAETGRLLKRLAQLKLVDLGPRDRVRVRFTRNFSWRHDGPVQRFLERTLLPEFFRSRFDEPAAEFRFFAAALTPTSLAQLKRALRQVAREFNDLAEQDTQVPLADRTGAAAVLALRPWHYSGFARYRREGGVAGGPGRASARRR